MRVAIGVCIENHTPLLSLSHLPQHLADGVRTATIPSLTAQPQQASVCGIETMIHFPLAQHCSPGKARREYISEQSMSIQWNLQ